MKRIYDYLIEHIKIEINHTSLLLEKYGLFVGCEEIVSKCTNDIKRNFRLNKRNFKLNYTGDDFDYSFFELLQLNCKYTPGYTCGGEYTGTYNNINNDKSKLKNVIIDIYYSDDWESLPTAITHEITHAYEDYNRSKKDNVKTLKDIEDSTYTNAINAISSWSDDLSNIEKALAFYIYLSNKSELNAFIASFSTEINNLNFSFDLTKQDIIIEAYNIIKNTSSYKKYKELDNVISNFDLLNKTQVEDTYNNLTQSNKTFNQIKKEITNNWYKIMNKINSTIPKIICDYIDKHTVSKKIEKLISKKIQ